MSVLADRIRELVQKEASERAFARKCGFSVQLLRKYLSGKTRPGADKCVQMAKAGGVSVDWLLGGSVNQSSQQLSRSHSEEMQTDGLNMGRITPQGDAVEQSGAQRAYGDLGELLALSIETHEWHAVGLIRRDLEALLTDIRRLYPDLVRRHPSAKDGAA